jgi:hypothetical protein
MEERLVLRWTGSILPKLSLEWTVVSLCWAKGPYYSDNGGGGFLSNTLMWNVLGAIFRAVGLTIEAELVVL